MENIVFKYFLSTIFKSTDFSLFSDFLIEVLLKTIFKILATFVVSTNISLLLLNSLRSLVIFLSFIGFKCCKTILNFIIKLTSKLFNQFLELKNALIEFQTDCEIIKNFKNTRSKKHFHEEQLIILEEWFGLNERNPYANKSTKQELAKRTNLSIEQVSSWLANKRASVRKNPIKSNKCFSANTRLILSNFYADKQNPNDQEIKV